MKTSNYGTFMMFGRVLARLIACAYLLQLTGCVTVRGKGYSVTLPTYGQIVAESERQQREQARQEQKRLEKERWDNLDPDQQKAELAAKEKRRKEQMAAAQRAQRERERIAKANPKPPRSSQTQQSNRVSDFLYGEIEHQKNMMYGW